MKERKEDWSDDLLYPEAAALGFGMELAQQDKPMSYKQVIDGVTANYVADVIDASRGMLVVGVLSNGDRQLLIDGSNDTWEVVCDLPKAFPLTEYEYTLENLPCAGSL